MSHSVLSRESKNIKLFVVQALACQKRAFNHVLTKLNCTAVVLALLLTLCGCVVPESSRISGEYFSVVTGCPVQLTSGAGNDAEASWSADGKRIAFQRELKGDLDIMLLDLHNNKISTLVDGPALACYPTWAPDGSVIYSYSERGDITASDLCGKDMNLGFNLRMLKDGRTTAITDGFWRDYTPSVSADGTTLYYASSRECTGNNSSLWKMPLSDPAKAECLISGGIRSEGVAQLYFLLMEGFFYGARLTGYTPTGVYVHPRRIIRRVV